MDAFEHGQHLALGLIPNPDHLNHKPAAFEFSVSGTTMHPLLMSEMRALSLICPHSPPNTGNQLLSPVDHTSEIVLPSVYLLKAAPLGRTGGFGAQS